MPSSILHFHAADRLVTRKSYIREQKILTIFYALTARVPLNLNPKETTLITVYVVVKNLGITSSLTYQRIKQKRKTVAMKPGAPIPKPIHISPSQPSRFPPPSRSGASYTMHESTDCYSRKRKHGLNPIALSDADEDMVGLIEKLRY